MKKTTIFVLLAIMVLVLSGCKKDAEPEPAPVVPEPEPTPVPEETVLPEADVPTEVVGEGATMISDVACIDGKITGRLTNTLDVPLEVGKTMKVLLRGLVVKLHGCEKTQLAPGESTACTSLEGGFPVQPGKNEVFVRATDKEAKATVTC